MLGDEVADGQRAEVVKRRVQLVVVPIPPGKRVEFGGDIGLETLADRSGGDTADDRVRLDILRHDGTCTDHRAIADRHAGKKCRAMADPHVVADCDSIFATPRKERGIVFGSVEIVAGPVREMVLARALGGMIGGIDTHGRGD